MDNRVDLLLWTNKIKHMSKEPAVEIEVLFEPHGTIFIES